MNYDLTSLLLGFAAFGFGLFTAYLRSTHPEKLVKLKPMKKFWGEKKGLWIHIIGYTILPIIFGLLLLGKGFFGAN